MLGFAAASPAAFPAVGKVAVVPVVPGRLTGAAAVLAVVAVVTGGVVVVAVGLAVAAAGPSC